MLVRSTGKWQAVLIVAFAALFCLATPCFGATATVIYEDGRLTVRAFDRPLEEILQALSTELDAEIYVADECRYQFVTADVLSQPVDAALARVLNSVSYAATYRGSGDGARISGLKVFPKGKAGSPLTMVKRGDGATVTGQSGAIQPSATSPTGEASLPSVRAGDMVPAPGTPGVLVPQKPELTGALTMANVKALEGLERERELHNEIRKLEAEAANAANDDAREALSVALREKIYEFQQLQKTNRNMQAALRRIELFEKQKATGAGH